MAAAFGGGNQGALFTLRSDLLLHGVQDFFGRGQVFDFVTQHFHAPIQSGFVNGLHHLGVDDVAFFKGFIQLQLTDYRAQRRLRQLRNGDHIVAGAVAGAHGIGHLKVENAVNLKLRVVARDADLAGDV